MKPKSAKAKGKRLENKVSREWRHKIDGFAIPTPGSGSGKYKADVYNKYFSIECKNQERITIWEWWQQTKNQVQFNKPPVLIFSSNHRPIMVTMELSDWLDLVKEAKVENK